MAIGLGFPVEKWKGCNTAPRKLLWPTSPDHMEGQRSGCCVHSPSGPFCDFWPDSLRCAGQPRWTKQGPCKCLRLSIDGFPRLPRSKLLPQSQVSVLEQSGSEMLLVHNLITMNFFLWGRASGCVLYTVWELWCGWDAWHGTQKFNHPDCAWTRHRQHSKNLWLSQWQPMNWALSVWKSQAKGLWS